MLINERTQLCQALKRLNKPAGFALGNAVGDGNGFANWMTWSHGAYLVDERAVEPFRGVVERLQLSHPDTAILCTGPWPPYSFVN